MVNVSSIEECANAVVYAVAYQIHKAFAVFSADSYMSENELSYGAVTTGVGNCYLIGRELFGY